MKVYVLFDRERFTGNDALMGIFTTREQLDAAYETTPSRDGELVAYSTTLDKVLFSRDDMTQVIF